MVDFYKRGNIQGLVSEARTYMQEIREEQMPPEDARTISIIRGGRSPSREEFAWDGEKLTTQGGIEQQHFESKEMQSKYYVTHNLSKLQLSQEEISEQLKAAHPDGVGYTKGLDKIVSGELRRLQNEAPDEQSRFEITQRGEAFRTDVLKSAVNEENKLIRNAVSNNFEETKKDLLSQARKSPEYINAIKLEMEDRVATAGQVLGWEPSKISAELAKQDKALVSESLWGQAFKAGTESVKKDLKAGLYSNYFSKSEANVLYDNIKSYAKVHEDVKNAPPIEELRAQANVLVATGRTPEDLRQEGKLTEPQLFVTTQAFVAEKQREAIPVYQHNKELLISREPKWMPDGVKTYRLGRLQELHDKGVLNEQSVALIDKETHEKLTVQANKLLAQSTYLKDSSVGSLKAQVDKGTADPTGEALARIKKDFNTGKLTSQEAKQQFEIIQNARRVLSWQ